MIEWPILAIGENIFGRIPVPDSIPSLSGCGLAASLMFTSQVTLRHVLAQGEISMSIFFAPS